jgi:hypothetical protein
LFDEEETVDQKKKKEKEKKLFSFAFAFFFQKDDVGFGSFGALGSAAISGKDG